MTAVAANDAKGSAVAAGSATSAKNDETVRLIEEELAILAKARTPQDSIAPLFNLHDLYYGSDMGRSYGWQLVTTARRAGRDDIALDAIRNIANSGVSNDSILSLALAQAQRFPDSKDREHTLTFIHITQNNSLMLYSSEEEKEKQLQELLQQLSINPPTALGERIELLYGICLRLSDIATDETLTKYLKQLETLIDQTDTESHALRNAYFVWSSMIYSKVHRHPEAVEACLKLLDEIDILDARNKELGRKYRTYDANRYIIYTRILQNFEGLPPEQLEKYHDLALEIASRDPRSGGAYRDAPAPDLYYYYAKKDYPKVFSILDGHLDNKRYNFNHNDVLKMYIESAKAIGRNDVLLKTYPEYIAELEAILDSRQQERFRELQVLYDVNDIRINNLRLQEEKQGAEKVMWRTVTIVCCVLLLVLILSLIVVIRLNRSKALLARKLERSNADLARERDNLAAKNVELKDARDEAAKANKLKTEFINNMSHEISTPLQAMNEYATILVENSEDDRRQFMRDFAYRLHINCSMVSRIIEDVIQLAHLSNSSLKVEKQILDSAPICEAAADTCRHSLAEGVTLKIQAENFLFSTDRHRLLQILNNLLSNAAKFTQRGTIILGCRKDAEAGTAVFTVEDSGVGIPGAEREHIFERFVKLSPSTPGAGIGLTIARMLAELMGGTLVLDTSKHSSGARFVLTLPLTDGAKSSSSDGEKPSATIVED